MMTAAAPNIAPVAQYHKNKRQQNRRDWCGTAQETGTRNAQKANLNLSQDHGRDWVSPQPVHDNRTWNHSSKHKNIQQYWTKKQVGFGLKSSLKSSRDMINYCIKQLRPHCNITNVSKPDCECIEL